MTYYKPKYESEVKYCIKLLSENINFDSIPGSAKYNLISLFLYANCADEKTNTQFQKEELERIAKEKATLDKDKMRAKALMRMHCQPHNVLGNKEYLLVEVLETNEHNLDITTKIISGWKHCFDEGEIVIWKYINSTIWTTENKKKTSHGAQSLLYIWPEYVDFERNS